MIDLIKPLFGLIKDFVIKFLPRQVGRNLMIEIAQQIINIGKHLFHLRNALLICRNRTDFPQGTADKFRCILSGTAVSPGSCTGSRYGIHDLFCVCKSAILFFQPGILPDGKLCLFDFLYFIRKKRQLPGALLGIQRRGLPLFFQFPVFLITGGKTLFFFSQRVFCIGIEDFQMFLFGKKGLMFMLSVNIDEQRRHLF